MKVYLVGVGGVGGFYGGLLAESGADITLVGRGESLLALKEKGLILHCSDRTHHIFPVKVIDNMAEITNPDLIILAVKSYDLKFISQSLIPVVKPETIVITIQNGLDNDKIVSRYLTRCQVLPGLVLVAASKTGANEITHRGSQKKLIFGSRGGEITQKMLETESLLRGAGIEASVTKEIARELWTKFLFVLSFSSATVARMGPIGEALRNSQSRQVYEAVLREAIAVGEREGIVFEADIFEKTVAGALAFDPLTKASLLVDLEHHRQTEVEVLQGALVRLAEKHSLPVPVTKEIYRKIVEPYPHLQ